jgi:hypothetical protein
MERKERETDIEIGRERQTWKLEERDRNKERDK